MRVENGEEGGENDDGNENSGAVLESMNALIEKVERNHRMLIKMLFEKPSVDCDTG